MAPNGTAGVGSRVPQYAADLCLRLFFRFSRLLRYDRRVKSMGLFFEHAIVPATDIRKRVRSNLALVYPEMPQTDREKILRGCIHNFNRIFMETYATEEFFLRVKRRPPTGPGFAAIEDAVSGNRPVIIVSGHIGNPQAGRVHLIDAGRAVGCVYRAMNNSYFNKHYVEALKRIGMPVFARGPSGTKDLLRFIKDGGVTLILNDQYASEGERLTFMGRPAMTSTAVARIAVRSEALLVPFYAMRRPDGLEFDVEFEAPVEHGDCKDMTQALNRSLERRVRANPDQYYWIHRRWKGSDLAP